MTAPKRVVDIVHDWAERDPDRVCLTFYEREGSPHAVTYGSLSREASAYATLFAARGLPIGASVVVFAHSVPSFVSAFLGAQEAGLVAVPCPPPEPLETGRRVQERVMEILDRCGAESLVNPAPGPGDAELALALAGKRRMLLTPTDVADAAGAYSRALRESPLAYCQFTSGSGGRAKGVLLRHEHVLASVRAMEEAFRSARPAEDWVAVTWLPLFHDMGLVGYVIMPLVLGYPCHLTSPMAFLGRPVSWLSLINRVRGTSSAAPNFAYGLCARKITDDECAGLDLSSWRVACNGAEPVTPEVVDAFTRRFAPYGFDPGAMLPCYGLAEATLCVTTRRPGEGARFERVSRTELERGGVARLPRENEPESVMVSVGRPILDHDVVILDTGGAPLPERRVGEIAVRSPSVMHGYLPGTQGEVVLRPDGWLLTGDLGYQADGEIFVAGRKKDLVVRGGRNYFPQDLEDAVSRVPGVRPGRAVAFAVVDPAGEQVVVAVECRPGWEADADALQESIRSAVFGAVRFRPDDVVLLPPHSLPLTSSGKVMRPVARTLYLEQWRTGP